MDGTIPTNDDAAEQKVKQPTMEADEWHCHSVLLECKKGEELVQAICNLYCEHKFRREMKMAYLGFDSASWRNS